MNKMLLVTVAVAVCVVAAVVIYFGYGPKPQPAGYFAATGTSPVIESGARGASWDSSNCWWSSVVVKGGTYYLFYSGSSSEELITSWIALNMSIGYATSTDGYTFTKSNSNPILTGAWAPAVLWDGSKWILYYSASVGGDIVGPVRRATAPDPSGPWTRDEKPVLELGGEGEWDSFATLPDCVMLVDGTYVMYYTAVDSGGTGIAIGRATSPDGITWTKYNNATTGRPYAESDPVLKPGKVYDAYEIWKSCVRKTATGWEMFYTGDPSADVPCAICYATSSDGIYWTKFEGNPIIARQSFQPTFFVKDSTYFLYYDEGPRGIYLATGLKPPFAP